MDARENAMDRGIGYGVALGLVTVGGAVAMFLAPGSAAAAWGFALAVTAGALSVAATQLY